MANDDLELLSAVFKATSALMVVVDALGQIVVCNPACEQLSGQTTAELSGAPFIKVFKPATTPPPHSSLETLLANNTPTLWTLQNGRTHWISWTYAPHASANSGRLMIATGVDVTKLLGANPSLAASPIHQDKILQTLPVGIWVSDSEGNLLLSNPEGQKVWGEPTPTNHHASRREIWSDDEVTFEEQDGTNRILHTQTIPLLNESAETIGSIMVSQDITPLKRVEDQLRQNENRARILAEISQSLADVSLDYQAVLDTTIERVTQLVGDLGTIQVLSEDHQEINTVAVYTVNPENRDLARQSFLGTRCSASAGIRAQVIASGLPMLIQEISAETLEDQINDHNLPYLTGVESSNLLMVPLRVHAEAFGLLSLSRQGTGQSYSVDDLNFVLELADRVALAIENARLYSDNLRQREELEIRVAKRTAEISVINQFLQMQLRERARIEEELRLSFDVSLDMLSIMTFDGYLTRTSPTWMHTLGWTFEELTNDSYLNLVHPEDLERTLKSTASLADGKVLIGFDNRFRCKDGSYRWLSWNSVGLPERGLIIAAARDITERKEAERRLAEVHELNQKIINNVPVGIFAYRPNGECVLANQSGAQIVGGETDLASQQNFRELSAWQGTILLDKAEEALESGQDQSAEIHTISGAGQEIWLDCFLSRFRSGSENHLLVMANDITHRKKIEDELQYMATHDTLTDLPNRHLFNDRLNQALSQAERNTQGLAVMLLDLDHFKQINDTYGHPTGDLLLKVVSARLTECLRKSDTVARMGGDEFTFIFQDINTAERATLIAQKILAAINQPVELCGTPHCPTASLGISLYPEHGDEPEILLRTADIAMYISKQERNRYTVYSGGVMDLNTCA